MTTLAVGVPDKAKVAFTMHSTRLVLNIGGRQVSVSPYGGSEGAKTSKTRHAWRVFLFEFLLIGSTPTNLLLSKATI